MKFAYPKLQFGIRFLLLLGILALLLFLMWSPDIDTAWLAGFGVVFLIAAALTTLTPMMTHHEITDECIILRQGVLFRTEIPFSQIETVAPSQVRLWALGFFHAGARNRIILATGNRNLVTVKMKARRRFGFLLWRSSREIIIDVEDTQGFVRAANEKLM
jgi:hypothetical protein